MARIAGSTDGYLTRSEDNGAEHLESPYAPLLPAQCERRVLRGPLYGMRLEWLRRVYDSVPTPGSVEQAARSILCSEAEERLRVWLYAARELAGPPPEAPTEFEADLRAWLSRDPELKIADPLRAPLATVLTALEAAQRSAEQRCGEQHAVAPRLCRLRPDYRFRAELLDRMWPRLRHLVGDLLPRLGLAVRYPNPSCSDVEALRAGDPLRFSAVAKDREFLDRFFDLRGAGARGHRFDDLDAELSSPDVARRLIASAVDGEAEDGARVNAPRLEAVARLWNPDAPDKPAVGEAPPHPAVPADLPTLRASLLSRAAGA